MKTQKPCMFLGKDEKGNDAMVMPEVTCCKRCSLCPWNPEEQARRLAEGRFVEECEVVIRIYSDSGDDHYHKVTYGSLRQLRFPSKHKKVIGETA